MKFARIADNAVQEIIEVTDLDDLKTRFTPDSVKEWVVATDSTEIKMTWDGSSFGAAPSHEPEESEEEKAAVKAANDKWAAMSTDEKWDSLLPDVPEYIKADATKLAAEKAAFVALEEGS